MSTALEIDRATLTKAVASAIGSKAIELSDWRHDSIHAAFNQATAGLYRISGTARDRGEIVPWSLILKVVQASEVPFGGSHDPTSANFWLREGLIYRSKLLSRISGIRAPRCFGVDQIEDWAAWIWLEEIPDHSGSRWPLSHYALAARRLGEFNGSYLAGRGLPVAGCLSQQWLRRFVGDFASAFARLPALRRNSHARRCWPDDLLDRVLCLWQQRSMLLDALDRLPQTFSHLDAHPRNLLIEPRTEAVVALDWSFAGIAGVGTELAPLVAAGVCFYDAEPEQMRSIDEIVFDSYMKGLRVAGFDVDPRAVRLGYTASVALHYGLFPLGVFMVDDGLRARFELLFSQSAGDIADRWAKAVRYLLDRADEARQLLNYAQSLNIKCGRRRRTRSHTRISCSATK